MMESTRRRGVMLKRLDMVKLHAMIQPEAAARAPEFTVFEVGWQPWAFAVAPDGRAYVVCSEGVGWEVDYADKKVSIDVYGSRPSKGGGKTISMLPSMVAVMDRADIEEILSDEEIDLADLIRQFGDRLESNFATWHRHLTRTKVPV